MEIMTAEAWFDRSLKLTGDPATLRRFRGKIARREPIVYGAIGGSITEGAGSSGPGMAYVGRIAGALQCRTACRYVNAGIGATGSRFAIGRVEEDLLRFRPDLITIEFAVNDLGMPDRKFTFEALVRRCRAALPDSLIVLIFTLRADGSNVQNDQIPIGAHYQLPMISYRDAIWPELEKGALAWRAISPDEVHPNDAGHRIISELVLHYLLDSPVAGYELPPPLSPECLAWQDARLLRAKDFKIVKNDGWSVAKSDRGDLCFRAETPGAKLVVDLDECRCIHAGVRKYAGGFGRADFRVDDTPARTLDGFYEMPENATWRGGHVVPAPVFDATRSLPRRMTVTVADTRHAQSTGHRFELEYLLLI